MGREFNSTTRTTLKTSFVLYLAFMCVVADTGNHSNPEADGNVSIGSDEYEIAAFNNNNNNNYYFANDSEDASNEDDYPGGVMCGTQNEQQISEESDELLFDNSTSACSLRGLMKNLRLESIKRDILTKLNLIGPPDVSGNRLSSSPRLKAIMAKARQDQNTYDDDPKSSILLFGRASNEPTASDSECRFHIKNDLVTKRLERASLGLYVRRPRRYEFNGTAWLLISFENKLVLKKKLHMTPNETNKWYQFNISVLTRDWLILRKTEILMSVVGSDSQGHPLAVVRPLHEHEEPNKPYIFLRVKEQMASRLKRTLNEDCDENGYERRCCRYPLEINFQAMGWDWIIIPQSYNAYYCSGDCPPDYKQTHPYTHIKQNNAELQVKRFGDRECCVARKYNAISLLFHDDSGNIVYSRIPNMVVEQCNCG